MLSFICTLSSCTQYIHVYETAPSLQNKKGNTVFENDSISIVYSFWNEGGVVSFSLYNKLNKPLYVDWHRSSFVKNNDKYSYWEDISNVKTTYTLNTSFINDDIMSSRSITSKPEQITFIPPRSTIYKVQFKIVSGTDKKFKKLFVEFKESNSIIKFRNFMTISISDKFVNEFYIDNEFYVSKIIEVSQRKFIGIPKFSIGHNQEPSPYTARSSFFVIVK